MNANDKKLVKNWLEWLVFGLGAVLILCVVGYLVYDISREKETRPLVRVTLGDVVEVGGVYMVEATLFNGSDTTLEGVVVEATLEPVNGERETAQFEVQFLPRRSREEGWVSFKSDPRRAKSLEARAIGFEEP